MTLHADHIGSLLRPPELLEARAAHDRGDLSDDALERAEDDAIVAALEVQRAAGLQILSDGEYRRSWFAGGLPSVIDGLVVLGLISSKFPELESRDGLLARIEEATEFVPIERLGLSPQCGFASTAPGNLITWDDQQRKLELVVSVADEVWGS
jgi:methionine synthase II (cobalamin-independent)